MRLLLADGKTYIVADIPSSWTKEAGPAIARDTPGFMASLSERIRYPWQNVYSIMTHTPMYDWREVPHDAELLKGIMALPVLGDQLPLSPGSRPLRYEDEGY